MSVSEVFGLLFRLAVSLLWTWIAVDYIFVEDNPVAFITNTLINAISIALFILVLFWIWDFKKPSEHYGDTKRKTSEEGEEHQE